MIAVMNIKKLLLTVLLLLPINATLALDGTGTVQKVHVCYTGSQDSDWKYRLLFQLSDGNWFGLHGDYIRSTPADYDSSIEAGLVLTAFSQSLPVDVRANYSTGTFCGQLVHMLWGTLGDYIYISK